MKKLNHKNIVKFFDYFENEKYLFLIMEMVKGESLYDFVKLKRKKKVTEEKALEILKEIAI